jgi:hypothetical protein
MDVLAAVLACSLHADDRLVRAIVESASEGNAFAVVEAAPQEEPDPRASPHSADEALARSAEIGARGGTPLFGLMQIPLTWGEMYGRSNRDLLDPCVNISIGTAMLSWFDRECASGAKAKRKLPSTWDTGTARRRECVLHKYGESTGSIDLEVAAGYELGAGSGRRSVTDTPAKAPILYLGGDPAAWGANQLFFRPDAQRQR